MPKEHSLLPFEIGAKLGIYTAIFTQYMNLPVNDCRQKKYRSFLEYNIATGWANVTRCVIYAVELGSG